MNNLATESATKQSRKSKANGAVVDMPHRNKRQFADPLVAYSLERNRLVKKVTALMEGSKEYPFPAYINDAIQHSNDREDTLEGLIATTPATSLEGAMVQIAMAFRLVKRCIETTEELSGRNERYVECLLYSAMDVLSKHTSASYESLGVDDLMGKRSNPWRDVHVRVAELEEEHGA